jgi:four helix bundle protein
MTNDQFRMTKEVSNVESSDATEIAFWGAALSVVREEPDNKPGKYDLEERTAQFGEAVIDFARTIPQGPVTNRLISQLVGAGTSIGANYCEADDAVSRKEFFLRIGTCRKEARETKYFLRMIVHAVPETRTSARALWDEARQLHLIFCKICHSKVASRGSQPAGMTRIIRHSLLVIRP